MPDADELLANYLEADQIAAEAERPLPPAGMSRVVVAGLWALRVFVVAISAMVIYVFVWQLNG